jgi:K+-sensing histidine kinase KdpD
MPPDQNHPRILACFDTGVHGEAVIRAAAAIAIDETAELYALHVELPGAHTRRDPTATRRLEELTQLAGDLGASIAVIADHRIADAIAQYALDGRITRIVVGRSQRGPLQRLLRGSIVGRLRSLLGGIAIDEV